MKGTLFLYVSKEYSTYSTTSERMIGRVTATKDTAKANEVEFKIALDIPDELFQKPTYQAQISIVKSGSTSASAPKLELSQDAVEVWLKGEEEK